MRMKRVLIVEDNIVLANLCKVNLLKKGYSVDMVHDGNLAIQSVNMFDPHLIVLDIILPNKDGFVILQEIKSHERHKKIDVVVYSSLIQQEDIDTFMNLGALAYYSKQCVGVHELVENVHTHISKSINNGSIN